MPAGYAAQGRSGSHGARNGLFPAWNEWHHRAMDQVHSMQVFVRVAQGLGFAAAARDLQMSPAAVSKHVKALESRLGTRLFDRTTRRVGLTEAGRVYLERCLECLQAFDDADACLSELTKEPTGVLRVTAPLDFRESLAPVFAEVMNAHPHVVVDLRLSNRVVDMVEEGVDVGIRVAHSLDGRYVARPLARTRLGIFGAQAYFDRHGRPRIPQDLQSHRNLVFTEPRPMHELAFVRDGQEVRVKVEAVMMSNDGEALMGALRRGVGLAVVPSFMTRADLERGSIEPVLLDWSLPEFRVFAVYPHRRFVSPKVKVFLEALGTHFGDGTRDPWWPEPRSQTAPAKPRRGRTSPLPSGA
jgi:DNA-binding transcriptional LysR family regulator